MLVNNKLVLFKIPKLCCPPQATSRRPLKRPYHIKNKSIKECFDVLGITPDSDQDVAREAYLKLVKLVHPDSGRPEASAERFTEIDAAFKTLQAKFAKERRGIEEEQPVKPVVVAENFDIKHTAPQHRQYLSYEGIGYGPPAQREKQYQQSRATKAYERVVEYRIDVAKASDNTSLMEKGTGTYFKKHAIKTKYGFDRVVEDLIQEAMSKGDFDNLSGYGKPLNSAQSQNPYVDFTQHKINKILLDNGFSPEWIMLQKEIREELKDFRESLRKLRRRFGPLPLNPHEDNEWHTELLKYQYTVNDLNAKIDKYNILVPILNKQMFRIRLDRLGDSILNETVPSDAQGTAMSSPPSAPLVSNADRKNLNQSSSSNDGKHGLFSFFSSLF